MVAVVTEIAPASSRVASSVTFSTLVSAPSLAIEKTLTPIIILSRNKEIGGGAYGCRGD